MGTNEVPSEYDDIEILQMKINFHLPRYTLVESRLVHFQGTSHSLRVRKERKTIIYFDKV